MTLSHREQKTQKNDNITPPTVAWVRPKLRRYCGIIPRFSRPGLELSYHFRASDIVLHGKKKYSRRFFCRSVDYSSQLRIGLISLIYIIKKTKETTKEQGEITRESDAEPLRLKAPKGELLWYRGRDLASPRVAG